MTTTGERLAPDTACIGRCQHTVHMCKVERKRCDDDMIQTSSPGLLKPRVHVDEGVQVTSFCVVWPRLTYFEISRVSKFYSILFDAIVSRKQPPSGRNGITPSRARGTSTDDCQGSLPCGKLSSLEVIRLNEADADCELYKLALLGMGTNSHARGGWLAIRPAYPFIEPPADD